MAPTDLQHWLTDNGYGEIRHRQPLSGGDICQTAVVDTQSGQTLCIKQHSRPPADFFAAEARGLQALRATQAQTRHPLTIPEVYGWGAQFIVMQYLTPAPRQPDFWSALGWGLAEIHALPAPFFGFETDNYCGTTPQKNGRYTDGYRFFAEQRLGVQARMALDQGHIQAAELRAIEEIGTRLQDLIPSQPPSLLHGDLWSGNVHTEDQGLPALIDPACHYGWAEADLAMTTLFGEFPERFYSAYEEVHSLEPGWRQRLFIYNLYHLLNHLNLFGGSYYRQVMHTVKRLA